MAEIKRAGAVVLRGNHSVLTAGGKQGRWYNEEVKQRNCYPETRFINFVTANHDADATNQGWKEKLKDQAQDAQDTEVNFGKND